LGLLDGKKDFGIYGKLSVIFDADTSFDLELNRVSFGYVPDFVEDLNKFNPAGYIDLDNITTINVSSKVRIEFDAGDLEQFDVGSLLGSLLGDINLVLNIENPFSTGLEISIDGNINISGLSIKNLLAGGSLDEVALTGIELCIGIRAINQTENLITIYYGKDNEGVSAVYVDAGNLGLPMLRIDISLEDMLDSLLNATPEVPEGEIEEPEGQRPLMS
jgi:hypothetical protein